MAANLARAGFPLTVWNRTPGRAEDLKALGATEAATPAEVGRNADIVVSCVADTPDVEAVLLGADGVAAGAARGTLIIDCSTISPSATRGFGERLAEQGIGIILISDDLPELLQNCDRILMMKKGRVSNEYRAGQLTEADLYHALLSEAA